MKKEIEISAPKGYSFKEFRDGKVVFERDALPTSWKEYCKNYPITAGECYVATDCDIITFEAKKGRNNVQDANVIKSTETAKAFLALNQLIYLRDVYRQGWMPNWREVLEAKHTIVVFHDDVCQDITRTKQEILSFQTKKLRDMFLENFKDLIEQAKELL